VGSAHPIFTISLGKEFIIKQFYGRLIDSDLMRPFQE
jgi:hypothetical protein